MTRGAHEVDVRRQAGWFPADQHDLEEWLAGHAERAAARGDRVVLQPSVAALGELIDSDPVVGMYVQRMIDQVPTTRAYTKRHLTSPEQLLRLINEVLTIAPEFGSQTVTLPLAGILDWAMGTVAGRAAFRDTRVNAAVKAILQEWCEFLSSPQSLYVLNDGPTGWSSEAARQAVGIDQYEHDPADPHWGFTSWNDFFTRRFREGQRPVAAPDDDKVIVSACESTPYNLRSNVQRRDRFWIKDEAYSLQDMLCNDPSVPEFVGGTVYQAFLSATNYHRWHSPVAGTVVRAYLVDGTYYSEGDADGTDVAEETDAQTYLAHVAARAVLILDADDPVIGRLAFVAVGMFEVSSCLFAPDIVPGHHLDKGEELGHFRFGGSTHCLVFRPGAISDVSLQALPQRHDPTPPLVKVRSKIATAGPTPMAAARTT
ncbi:MAG: phosphatidylserine decarboxylase family protein [Mycobacteriales bacterium]